MANPNLTDEWTLPTRYASDYGTWETDHRGRLRKVSDYPPPGFYPVPEWRERPVVSTKHGPYSDVDTRRTHWKTPDPAGLGRRIFWQSGPCEVWTDELYRPGLYGGDG